MDFLANENIPLASSNLLIEKGHNVTHIGQTYSGITDREIIAYSNAKNRIIITLDSDYGELIFKHGLRPSCGVIYLRINNYDPQYPAQLLLDNFISSDLHLSNTLTVFTESGIRQRKY
jgi:predicted nuclease of predicted toxin-antitoxin system